VLQDSARKGRHVRYLDRVDRRGSGGFVAAFACCVLATLLVTGTAANAQTPDPARTAPATATPGQWVDSWAASFLSTTVNGVVQAAPSFNNQTYRLNVFSKLGGTQVRVKLSNKFATNPLTVGAVHLALVSSMSSIVPTSDRVVTFGGLAGVTVAPGAEIWSDPVALTIGQHVTVAISVYVPGSFHPTTFHPTGLHTSYISRPGNFTSSSTLPLPSFGGTTTEIVMVAGLQVWAPTTSSVAVAFGDSITDGACAANNANGTWPDILSTRVPALPSGAPFAVINMGIGSNRLVASDLAGPSGVHRFADDVLARPNVGYVVVLEGINDISYHQAVASTITDAYATLIAQAHAAGIKVYGATLLPIGNSSKYTVANEATRQAVNAWIRAAGHFDAVLDFEAVVKDPATNPLRIKSTLTCDYVHPNAAGYAALGNSIPTSLFG
jgi:lysophospholipase L1-like esterase